MITQKDLLVKNLGVRNIQSPLPLSKTDDDLVSNFVEDDERFLYEISAKKIGKQSADENCSNLITFEAAGPREKIFFDPQKIKCGIVSCGGLCPGINSVIRSIVMELGYRYGCRSIYGFRYGYLGLVKDSGFDPLNLTSEMVEDIHLKGGSILGSSRGHQDVNKMVDRLMNFGISVLFCIGGDGTLRAAHLIAEEILNRGLNISVIGVPKTIDNDINYVERTFGFETAFSIAVDSIKSAHTEAKDALNGIGIVRLMGRDSGYIAANAALASQDVNYVLVPEIPFDLEGKYGLFNILKKRLEDRRHAVIVIAEGAGQNFFGSAESRGKDSSGNIKLGDIGVYLKERISEYFKSINFKVNLKYIDPSYIIRSAPPIPSDAIFCNQLAQNAVHAGMAGKTDLIVGIWNNHFSHVPISIATQMRKIIDPESTLWLNVTEATGQPSYIGNDPIFLSKLQNSRANM
ncbi:MAG TPA: ATP-dependent 6-phosphofructokinase [Candidatus Wallbacteria bacterium]|nr:ATP-dependent 6-phosphofructokinase [Candidatus Wallbacteria bacterium]